MSDFVLLFRSTPLAQEQAMGTPERAQQSMQSWLAWIRDLEAKGHLKDPGQPLARQGKVITGKDRLVTDGPFTEVKDVVLGFIVIRARDLEEATAVSKACPILEGGSVEVRPIMAMSV
jgi:hypothetical protein